ncbi:MAG: hypothetical protein JWQ86_2329, partial [Mycobacterium sp.]|nr:hypothetical protein [Mycobacterium sp.]
NGIHHLGEQPFAILGRRQIGLDGDRPTAGGGDLVAGLPQ